MSFLAMGQLNAVADPSSPEAIGERGASPYIRQYVDCLARQGLQRAFYLQDPRQEIITSAHRRGDPCYKFVSEASLQYAKANVDDPIESAEYDAELAATRNIGRVRAGSRPQEIVTPRQQLEREARARREAELQRARIGPLSTVTRELPVFPVPAPKKAPVAWIVAGILGTALAVGLIVRGLQ